MRVTKDDVDVKMEIPGAVIRQRTGFGDASGFSWRDTWITSTLFHRGGRDLAGAVLALMAVDAARPILAGPSRAERVRWLATTVACLLLVPALKRASLTSCPWDLQAFGGVAIYVPHWRLGVPDGGPGHCFPSGHAVAAFAFMTGHFLWRQHRPVMGRLWLAAVGLAGLAFGGAQVVRGAHFPSHVLWSAWVCWVVCTFVARPEPRRLSGHPSNGLTRVLQARLSRGGQDRGYRTVLRPHHRETR